MQLCRNNPHPARGRKLVHQPDGFVKNDWKQPTPRKGTETSASRPGSPSGLPRNNPHPARGRKPSRIYPTILLATWKQPTPRKGTETRCKLPQFLLRYEILSPARGRKRAIDIALKRHVYRNTLHPARGRKHCLCCSFVLHF